MSLYKAPSVCESGFEYWVPAYFFGFLVSATNFLFLHLTPTFPSRSLCPSLPTHFPYPPLVKPQPLVTVSPSTLSLMGNVLFFVNILSPSTLVACIFCNVMVGFLKLSVYSFFKKMRKYHKWLDNWYIAGIKHVDVRGWNSDVKNIGESQLSNVIQDLFIMRMHLRAILEWVWLQNPISIQFQWSVLAGRCPSSSSSSTSSSAPSSSSSQLLQSIW